MLPLYLFVAAPPKPGLPHGLLLASQTSTPRLTPPGSPPSYSATASPTKTSKPGSPRRHAMSFSTSRGMTDGRSSMFSSMPPSSYGSMTGSDKTGKLNLRFDVANANYFHFLNLIIIFACDYSRKSSSRWERVLPTSQVNLTQNLHKEKKWKLDEPRPLLPQRILVARHIIGS